jgi:hypothetical protein
MEDLITGKTQNTSSEEEPRKRGTSAGDSDSKSVPDRARYIFEGTTIKLREHELNSWANAFSHINLLAELHALDEYAGECVAKGKGWYGPIASALARRNREVKAESDRMRAEIAAKF